MTDSLHTTFIQFPVPGGVIDAESITYENGTTTYHVGFTTLDASGMAVRSSVVSQHENVTAAIRAAERLNQHVAHILSANELSQQGSFGPCAESTEGVS